MDSFKQKIPPRSKSKLRHMALIPFFIVDYFNINNTGAEKTFKKLEITMSLMAASVRTLLDSLFNLGNTEHTLTLTRKGKSISCDSSTGLSANSV